MPDRKFKKAFIKPRLGFFIAYCILLFVVFESLCRIVIGSSKLIDGISDSESRLNWISRHRLLGREIIYEFDIFSPTRGWAVKPGLRNAVCFDNKALNSNSKGIRGSVEYSYNKTHDKTRILILGDSFTFGDECSDIETYPFYLQQIMPETEVINLGVHGYGHDQMLIYFKEEGCKYKPDIVMVGFIVGDTERNMLSFRDYAKPRFELVNGRLILRNSPVPAPETTLKNEIWRLRFVDLLDIIRDRFLKKIGWYGRRQFELSRAILEEIATISKKQNALPVFLYLQSARDVESSDMMTPEERDFLEYWQNRGVECIFLRQYVKPAHKQGVKIRLNGHFDSTTNQIIAEGIKAYLLSHNLVVNNRK